jgi:3-dehydroquinate synthase
MDRNFELPHTQRTSVIVQPGAEARLPDLLQSLHPDGAVVVHDAALGTLAQRIGALIGARALLPVDANDDAKRLVVVGQLAEQLHAAQATRATVMVAIGGGTLTDLAGFVASIYLRGMPLVSCPTTTLAMCDAALGGKNGVDHCGLKNRLGTIRQPNAIVMDTDWLQTLPDEMFREGLVEVIKKASVLDADRFAELEQLAPALLARDPDATMRTVLMAVDMNTVGHAIESLAAGAVRHGHAVAMGLLCECRAAIVDPEVTQRIANLLHAVGVGTDVPQALRNPAKLWQLAQQDKKAMRGHVPMYVPQSIGHGIVVNLDQASLTRAML